MLYPSIKFVFDRKHVATSTRRGLVQIEILYKRKRKWIGTGIKLLANQWHPQRMVVNTPEAAILNANLLDLSAKVRKIIDETIDAVGDFSFAEFEQRFKVGQTVDGTYIDYVSQSIEARKDIGYYTKKNHRTLITALMDFGKIVRFSDLTRANIVAFDNYLKSKNYLKATYTSLTTKSAATTCSP